MNTKNDGGMHPMVMKAARAQNAIAARMTGMDPEQAWLIYRECHIKDATEMLTECGALECLEALSEIVESNGEHGLKEGRAAIAKATADQVYGSAP